jgi:uncharacterized membrane protein
MTSGIVRRRVATIASVLAAEFAVLGMRQFGAIRRLPDVPLPGFDANAVTTAPNAYPLGIPDSAIAVSGLGAIVALATTGGALRRRHGKWLDRGLATATTIGMASAAYYLDNMIRRQRRICIYCVVGAVGFAAMFALSVFGRRTGD